MQYHQMLRLLIVLAMTGSNLCGASFVAYFHQPTFQRGCINQSHRLVLQGRLTGNEIRSRLEQQLKKLRAKDQQSLPLTPEKLNVVYEDNHIVLIDKPSGILTIAAEESISSLAKVVFDYCQKQSGSAGFFLSIDNMVVHRLGMDTSGLILFAKTLDAARGMNTLFRTRKITRQYEALVCGHFPNEGPNADQGFINLPLMRDYEFPPFIRVSTDEHQRNLVDLDPQIVGRKLLEAPKASLTHYQVKSREYLNSNEGCPVTRLTLNSISGRTHQLNVHCAAFGHPIVRDSVYGYQGQAAPFGGLQPIEIISSNRVSDDQQRLIHEIASASNMSMCIHANLIRFKHPRTKIPMEFTSPAPF